MKKYFYILSIIVVCLSMCNVTLAATSLKDISGTKYEDAVENLVEIGLVNGYPEDNTYRPSVTVTRAQMAKMMVIALGEEGKVSDAAKKSSTFTDIKSGHWAYGYVNVAKDLGIINGYPDGSFGPEDIVTYAEASTMALRALGYEDEIAKSTEIWPNNYISYGKKLSLYSSVGNFESNKGANRGDVALILWNMLRTGVCTVKGSNNSGLIYGQGMKMINKYKDFVYEKDAIITDVTFKSNFEKAEVNITGLENTKATLDDGEVLKYFGRNLEFLYDEKDKEFIFVKDSKKYTQEHGNVTYVNSKRIDIDDKQYTLPKSDYILLYKTDKLSNAVDATVYLDGNTVKYILASGAKDVYVGVVADTNVEIQRGKYGIKLKKLGSSSSTSYILIDKDEMPLKGSVIIYHINSDNELGILKELDIDYAKSITTATNSEIKVNGKTYDYVSSDFVVVSATTSSVNTMTFKNIDKSKDLAYVYEYAGKTYVIVYEDSVEDTETKNNALNELKKYISEYAYLESKEASYSQSTFKAFLDAMTYARSMTSSSRLVNINTALSDLKVAKNALKAVTSRSEEGKIASYRAQIRALVKNGDTIVNNKLQYTDSSYSVFYAEYTAAKRLLSETDNTLSKAQNMHTSLNSAITKLVKISTTQEHKDALRRLNDAITAYGSAGPESNYTVTSFAQYKTARDNAINAQKNPAAISHNRLDELATKLKEAFDNLDLAIDTLKAELDALILDCMIYENTSGDYMPITYSAFSNAMKNAVSKRKSTTLSEVQNAKKGLEDAVKNLREIQKELQELMTIIDSMKTAPAVSNVLRVTLPETSKDKLGRIENIKSAVKTDLGDLIDNALEASFKVSGDTRVDLLNATSEAESALNNAKKVNIDSLSNDMVKTMVNAYVKLVALVPEED